MKAFTQRQIKHQAGWTLVEILLVITILGLVSAGAAGFFISTGQTLFVSDQKLKINRDIRSITNEMTDVARAANYFVLFKSFYELETAEPPSPAGDFRKPPVGYEPDEFEMKHGNSGDFLLLVFEAKDPNPNDTDPPHIERLVGYYRSIDDEELNIGPVRKFDVTFSEEEATKTNPEGFKERKEVHELVPKVSEEKDFSTVIELSRGLANGKLFYNLEDRSVMINGQIFHGNAAKRVTDTYNFTVSPRG